MSNHLRFVRRALSWAALLAFPGFAVLAQHPPALAATTPKRPDEFGTQAYTVTVIQAGSFTSDTTYHTDYGSLFRNFYPVESAGHFFAGVDIPAGAVIDFIGIETSDDGHYPGYNFQVNLYYVDQHSGTTSGIVSVTCHAFNGFGTTYNSSALGWQLVENAHNALVLDVYQVPFDGCPILQTCRTHFGFGWVEIWWHRAVSPAPATPSFNDVPTTDFGYQYIEALKASGITGGCGDGTIFCPNANVTRRQMAIFLAKSLGLHWPN